MLRGSDRPRLASRIEQSDGYNHRYYDRRQNPRSESPPPRYNRDDRRSRLSPSYQPYSNHHRNPRYEDVSYHNTNNKDTFSDSEDDEELKGLTFPEYRRLKRQKLRKKLKNCVWQVTPSPPRSERDRSEPLDEYEEDEHKKDDDLDKKKKHRSVDDDKDSGNKKSSRPKRSHSDDKNGDDSDSSSGSDSFNDSDESKERKSSRKIMSRKSKNDTEEVISEDSDDSRSRKSYRKKKKNGTDEVNDSSDGKRKQSRKKHSRRSRMDSDAEVSDDSLSDRKRSSRKKRSRNSSSRRRKSSSSSRSSRRKSRKSSVGSSEESEKEEDGSSSDLNPIPKKKKSSRNPDIAIPSDSEAHDELKTIDIDMKKTELDPEALAYKELLESHKINKVEETDAFVGPAPLPRAEGHISYGGALRPGEGDAIAQYVQQGKRIPRRGEVGLSADEIQRFENLGYVMSGSRHQRMNAIRIRKENQVYSAEDKRALAMFNYEEKSKREHKVMADLQRLVQRHIGHDVGPSHDPFGKDTDAADT